MRINLYRKPIEVTKPGDLIDSYEMGPLRAQFWKIRIPVRFALWWLGIDLRILS